MSSSKQAKFLERILEDLKESGHNIGGASVPELTSRDLQLQITDAPWLIIRQHVISKFMDWYLMRYGRFKDMKRVFIELKPGTGITRVKLPNSPDTLNIPCASLLAAYKRTFDDRESFEHVFSCETSEQDCILLENKFITIEQSLPEERKGSLNALFYQEESNLALIKQTMVAVKKAAGSYFNYLFFVDNEEPWIDIQSLKYLRIFKYGDVIMSISDDTAPFTSKKELVEQLKSVNMEVRNELTCKNESGKVFSLLFCPRKEYNKWEKTLKRYKDLLLIPTPKLLKNIRNLLVGKKPGFVSLVELIKNEQTAGIPRKDVTTIKNIVIYKKNQGYVRPLVGQMEEKTWRDMLSKHAFDKLKINNRMVLLKKKITATDLNLKSACIQGKIRQKLDISSLDDREVYLLDRRTNEYSGPASFPKDGRLDGTAFWLRKHGDKIQDGNYLFLSKIADDDRIILLIDYYQQLYPLLPFLEEFFKYYLTILRNDKFKLD